MNNRRPTSHLSYLQHIYHNVWQNQELGASFQSPSHRADCMALCPDFSFTRAAAPTAHINLNAGLGFVRASAIDITLHAILACCHIPTSTTATLGASFLADAYSMPVGRSHRNNSAYHPCTPSKPSLLAASSASIYAGLACEARSNGVSSGRRGSENSSQPLWLPRRHACCCLVKRSQSRADRLHFTLTRSALLLTKNGCLVWSALLVE